MDKKNIFTLIKDKEVKMTSRREDIVKIFIANRNEHLTAYDIYNQLKKQEKSIGLATIYRTLDILEKANIIAKRDFDSDISYYEMVIDQSRHSHLICKKCGRIIEIPDLLPEDIKERIQVENNFNCIYYSTKFHGYCSQCREEELKDSGQEVK